MSRYPKSFIGFGLLLLISAGYMGPVQAQCWRCIAIDWNAYCTSSYVIGGRTCTSFGTTCITEGSCAVTPPLPPLPPLPPPSDGVHSLPVEHSTCADEGPNFKQLSDEQRAFLTGKSVSLGKLFDGLFSPEYGLRLGVMPHGIQVLEVNGKPHAYEFFGEIHSDGNVMQLYFEFADHPELSALEALMVSSSDGNHMMAGYVTEWLLSGEKRTY